MLRSTFLAALAALGCQEAKPDAPLRDAPAAPSDAAAVAIDAGDEPAPDAGTPTDAAASTSPCATSRAALCDGFESDALDPSVWTVDGLAPTIDASFAAAGSRSLHFVIEPTSSVRRARISETKTFPAANDSFFGRVFVYVANATPSFHMGIVWGAQEKGTESVYAIGTGRSNLLVNYKDPTVDDGVNDGKPFPVNRWVCLEWQFDGVGNVANIWLDGVADPGATLTGYTAPRFDHLFVGMALYAGTTPVTSRYELWLDEVAVDGARVGCDLHE